MNQALVTPIGYLPTQRHFQLASPANLDHSFFLIMNKTLMDGLTVVAAATSVAISIMAIFVGFPPPQKDPQALANCLTVHPERYCRITYDGLKP